MKTAVILGVTGQDGSYLAELLLDKGYYVVGIARRVSTDNTSRIFHLLDNPDFELKSGDITDPFSLYNILSAYEPIAEVYNLAAQSHVGTSFDQPSLTWDVTAKGVLNVLEYLASTDSSAKLYQASSSEMFGTNPNMPLSEESILMPASPYACAKVYGHHIVQNYRDSYGMFACSGILFNHESPRRGETFVTRKITMAAAKIKLGLQKELRLGNLDAKRDWGFAGDYVEAMWLMLQQESPDDYVIATGTTHTVRDFLKYVFDHAGLGDYNNYVKIDPRYLRPSEVPCLLGNAEKAKAKLNWEPKVNMEELAALMYEADLKLIRGG